MLAFGANNYWGRKGSANARGIVVVFAWMCSEEKHLKNYVQLYSSLGWDSFICHAGCFNMFVPSQATSLAFQVLDELVKELKTRPCPVVFASFSGGPKACLYKVLQIIEGNCEAGRFLEDYQLIRDYTSGFIFDSCPMDFYSEVAFEFFLHPSVIGRPQPPKLLSWTANSVRVGLDALFITWSESQRAEYWQTLYASVSIGVPYLLLCSETDELAAYQIICNFAQRLQELGASVKLVKWDSSPHVAHYRIHPDDYRAAVTELLGKAAVVYSRKCQHLDGDRRGVGDRHGDTSMPISGSRVSAKCSRQSFHGLVQPSRPHLLPSSMEYCEGAAVGPVQDDDNVSCMHLPSPPSVRVSGALGHILFDEIVPENVEEWDVTDSTSCASEDLPFPTDQRLLPLKFIRRCRL